ncbi:UbiA family prenyltransferase [Micromonospora rifamycinica]|uniref:4-hydroxybenzoate polyprenyltransferase n=1 Tax=Micromonospora rifamycinica TaxID=291594 RepID=A0A1C5HYQ7_9ACTN|nr:UbiA family prenyltransferase [Micromonospora rifamycinica]SCG51148.1 4-hydroxybenzoate polyprenyltransferase [Micromonospora rifamycinica]
MSTAGVTRALRAHVETWRPYTLWYVGMVGLAGAALTDGPHHPWLLASAWAAPTAGWLGGHYLGDYFDRDLDAGSKPHRPIPSGRLRPGTALWCGSACFAVLALLAVLGGWGTTAAALLAACGIVAYSSWGKARGIAGNLVRGALGAIALLYGALTVGLPGDTASTVPVLLASMVAFWSHDTMSNLVGALRDIDGDRAGGYLTLPVRRGTPFAVNTVLALYAVTVAAALTAGLLAGPSGRPGYLVTLLVVLALGGTALAPLVTHRADMPVLVALRAHAVLVVERVVLASALVGLGLGVGPQLALALPMVGLTWWSQRLMRTRHELGTGRPVRTLTTPRRAALEDVS